MRGREVASLIYLKSPGRREREREMVCDGDDGKTKKACRCCAKEGLKRGAWSVHEDRILKSYMKTHGEGKWRELPEKAGKDRPTSKQIKLHFNNTSLHQCIQMGLYVYLRLMRCGRSCRFRWFNYLRPDIKRGNISQDEEDLILRLHRLLGNRWSLIAGRLPGRTDTEIKNHWKTTLRWKLKGKTTKKQLKRSKNKKLKGTSSAAAPCDEVSISQQEGNHMNTKNTEIALDKENSSRSVDESLNFLMDSDIGDICISDFLTSDFLQVCCDEIHEDKNATGGDHGRNDNSFCCVGHPFSTHEMIENSSHEAILENRTGCDTAQTNSTWELSWLNFVPGFRE